MPLSSQLPDEMKMKIYNNADIETRIKLNKEFKWNFYFVNPFKDFHPFGIPHKSIELPSNSMMLVQSVANG
jgi:hypothetical protein